MVHGGRYFTFFTEELPKVCQAFFPISDKREDTFIAGLSMGGNGAMRLALKRPDLYSQALCMSGAAFDVQELKRRAAQPPFNTAGDVYKRQGVGQSKMILALNRLIKAVGLIIIPIGVILFLHQWLLVGNTVEESVVGMVAALIGTVSYTHLDVYKRQAGMRRYGPTAGRMGSTSASRPRGKRPCCRPWRARPCSGST